MGEVATLATWVNKLARRKNGEPYPDERNILIAFEHDPNLKGIFAYDEFADRVELTRPPPGAIRDELAEAFADDAHIALADDHITAIMVYLLTQGFVSLRSHILQDVAILVAKGHGYHPVRQFLDTCEGMWDKRPRLDGWLSEYLGAKDNEEYLHDVGSKFLIGAVARIFEPGCQMDSILVLEGEQGEGKTRAVRKLGGEWTSELSGDFADKDAAIALQSVWIVELAELTALRRAEQEPVKAFISRRVDHYRPPYGRNSVMRPRHTVFIATTNENDYLQDPTGARRYWPVACSAIDYERLGRDAAQLWGEAASRYHDKEPWHLNRDQNSRAKAEQAARQRVSVVDATIIEYLEGALDKGTTRVEMKGLLLEVFNCSTLSDPHKAAGLGAIAARTLMSQGWRKLKPTGRGRSRVQAYEYAASQCSQSSQSKVEVETESKSQSSQCSQSQIQDSDEDIPF